MYNLIIACLDVCKANVTLLLLLQISAQHQPMKNNTLMEVRCNFRLTHQHVKIR